MGTKRLQASGGAHGAHTALVLGCLAGAMLCTSAWGAESTPAGAVLSHSEHVQGTLWVYEPVPSESLGPRRILVWLPASYAWDRDRRYPVLYAFDGQNLFDPDTAGGHEEWMLDELLVRQPEGVVETIVVGIVPGAHAVQEYAPPGSQPDARADVLLGSVIHELKPWIDATYRTRPDRASTMLLGCGTSALAAVYGAWTYADAFAGAIALEFPDADEHSLAWIGKPPTQRPWIWLEQKAAEKSRPSTTQLLAELQLHADVRVIIPGPDAGRPTRIVAALRARPQSSE